MEPYLKLLAGWLATTRTMKTQRGMTILHHSNGDLKTIINELDIMVLTSENGGHMVFDHIQRSYQEYMDKQLPKAMERAMCSSEGRRHKNEGMIQYVARKRTLLNELTRAKCLLSDEALGYIVIRDAGLTERAWDTLETWTR